ncbi:MAG: class I SAM-dependent methyltransferase [Myxococcota bacterium]
MEGKECALVGSDPLLSEPGAGTRIDTSESVWRIGPAPAGSQDRLGTAPGLRVSGEPEAFLAELLSGGGSHVFLCGFDPRPFRELIDRGLESGRFVLAGALHRRMGRRVPGYGLAAGYRSNPVRYFDDTELTDEWQREVYDLALRLARQSGARRILDVGCGSGYKLVRWFGAPEFRTIGVDLPDTVAVLRERYPEREWLALDLEREDMLRFRADVVIASDVIEHLADPDLLLRFLAGCDAGAIVLSTPEAATLVARRERDPLGPPRNPHHVREWTWTEFSRYVSGTLEVLHQELHEPNATQILVCRPAVEPQPRPAVVARRPASLRLSLPPGTGSPVDPGWLDGGAEGYAERSRTRTLESILQSWDAEHVTLNLGLGRPEPLATPLEDALRDGAEIAWVAARSAGTSAWNPVDGLTLLACSRTLLLEALRRERGPYGPERAALRLAAGAGRCRVLPTAAEEDPEVILARVVALLDPSEEASPWPDARPLLGPLVRGALGRAIQQGRTNVAHDLAGFWSAATGRSRIHLPSPQEEETTPWDPELRVPLDEGSFWLEVDPHEPASLRIAMGHAARPPDSPVLNLALPWSAGVPIIGFARSLETALREEGLDPRTIAPLVVLERPLFAAELHWLARRLPRLSTAEMRSARLAREGRRDAELTPERADTAPGGHSQR